MQKFPNHGTFLERKRLTILFIPIVLNISEILWSSFALHSTNKAFTLLAYSSPFDLGTWRGGEIEEKRMKGNRKEGERERETCGGREREREGGRKRKRKIKEHKGTRQEKDAID